VENQVGLVRERFFRPRLRFKTSDELNAWLMDRCALRPRLRQSDRRPPAYRADPDETRTARLLLHCGRGPLSRSSVVALHGMLETTTGHERSV
jgi:hypothetical protein